jgi:hypothetical protein
MDTREGANPKHTHTSVNKEQKSEAFSLRTIPVWLKVNKRKIKVNAILDDASNETFLNEEVAGAPDCIVCKTRAGCLKLSFIMRACSLLRRNMRAKLCTLIVTRAVFPEYTIQII